MICDNEAAVFFSGNSKRSNNSKHIGLKYFSVRQRVKRKEVIVEHIGTESQLADPFTKTLSAVSFQKDVRDMGILPELVAGD